MSTLRRFADVRWLAPLGLLAGALATVACTAPTDDDSEGSGSAISAKPYDPVDDLDESLGEKLWPNEQNDIKATSEIIQTFIKRRQAEGRTDTRGKVRFLRDAHAKMHGCVKGEFTVRGEIPGGPQGRRLREAAHLQDLAALLERQLRGSLRLEGRRARHGDQAHPASPATSSCRSSPNSRRRTS